MRKMTRKQMIAFVVAPTLMGSMALASPNGAKASKSTDLKLTGEIVSVSTISNQLTLRVVENAKPTEKIVAIETGTVIRGQGKPLHLTDLKTGDKVTVLCEPSQGKLLARSIHVQKL